MIAKSVLIVTYGFPPHIKSLGGAIRMLKLAEYLQSNGCEVHVLCARTPHVDSFGYDALLSSLSITYIDDPVAMAGARVFNAELDANIPTRSLTGVLKHSLKRCVIAILTPDTAMLTVGRMRRAATRIVAANPGMTVITSGPPHSIHFVGKGLKRRFPAIQWLADYRDSWNGSSLFRKKNWLLQALNEAFERRVLRASDGFTYISHPMLQKAARWGGVGLAAKAHLVANGYDSALLKVFQTRIAQPGPLRLGYFGAIDDGPASYRNPECLLAVVAALPELDIRLEFYGAISISPVWQQRLGPRLLIGPRLAHRDVFVAMAGMDALMLLHTREDGADEVVTGKVFEYVASSLPIVSIGPAEMAVNKLLADDETVFCAAHTDGQAIGALLSHLVRLKAADTLPVRASARLATFSRERQFAIFLDLIAKQASRQGKSL